MPKPLSAADRRELQEHWLETIEHEGVNLTTWEEDFIESIRSRMDAGQELSERQAETLEAIYAKRTA